MEKSDLIELQNKAFENQSIIRIFDQKHGSEKINFTGTLVTEEEANKYSKLFAYQNQGIIEIFEGKTVVTTEKRIRTYIHVGFPSNL